MCLNVGCIPSKALITAGNRFEEVEHADDDGHPGAGRRRPIDMKKLQAWKQTVVDKLTGGVRTLLKANKVDDARRAGEASCDAHTVEVATAKGVDRATQPTTIVIATGSRPIEIPGFSFEDPRILDSTKALALPEIPKRLVVIGGGYIGLELGRVLQQASAPRSTVVEMIDSAARRASIRRWSASIARQMKKQGIEVLH